MAKKLTTLFALTIVFSALGIGPSVAQDAAAPESADEAPADEAPADEAPADEAPAEARPARDMLRLTTGETLQGEVVQLKDGKLKFKSESLAEQEIPLEKVASLRTAKPVPVLLGEDTVTGHVDIDGDAVRVSPAGEASRTVTRGELTTINPDPEKTELDYWSFHGTLGATLTFGNTRNRTGGVVAILKREDDWTRAKLGYSAIYGESAGVETAKSHRGDGQFDIKITDRFYATPFVGHAFYDKFQNIELRYQVGVGAGYEILKEENMSWNGEVGFAYGYRKLRTPGPGDDERIYTTSARVATTFHWDMSGDLAFDLFYEAYIGTKDIEDTTHRTVGQVSLKLIKGLAFTAAAIYDRVERVGRGPDGSRLKRDDLKLILGLSLAL